MKQLNARQLGRLCGRLSGYALSFAARVADAATEPFRHRLPADREVVDLFEYQVFLAEEVDAKYAEVTAWEGRLAEGLERLGELRELRDRLVEDLRSTLHQVRHALRASYDERAVRLIFGEVSRLPRSAADLLEMAERIGAGLTDPALELPPPHLGVEVDLAEVAHSFAAPMAPLGQTLALLPEMECAVVLARSHKSAAVAEARDFSIKVSRFFEALCDVAGHERIADRVLRGQRRKS